MPQNDCLVCKGTDFIELLHLEQFPIFFGAVHSEKISKVECFPLTIAICDQCSLVQQINLLEEKILNEVYTAEYYNCPSPLMTGMGISEIDKFYSFFQSCKLTPSKLLEIACFDGYLLEKLKNE